jgi:hypothetical protein
MNNAQRLRLAHTNFVELIEILRPAFEYDSSKALKTKLLGWLEKKVSQLDKIATKLEDGKIENIEGNDKSCIKALRTFAVVFKGIANKEGFDKSEPEISKLLSLKERTGILKLLEEVAQNGKVVSGQDFREGRRDNYNAAIKSVVFAHRKLGQKSAIQTEVEEEIEGEPPTTEQAAELFAAIRKAMSPQATPAVPTATGRPGELELGL